MKGKKILSSEKLLTLMKIGITQTMIALVICGVSLAHDNHAQILNKQVSIDLKNVPLKEVLEKLTSLTEVKFAYGIDHLNLKEKVSVSAEKSSLGDVLDDVLTPLQIRYKVHEREGIIALKKQESRSDHQTDAPRMPSAEPAQTTNLIPVAGKVTTNLGEPMPGVNIIVKGTTNGTTTDTDGHYTIHAEINETLSFSFIGYNTVEVVFTGQASVDVTMTEDITSLNEVTVNAGYYTTTKELQTGSIVKIEAEDIQRQPVSNPIATLQGRAAGVEVIQQNGVPGGNFKVRIRGVNSLSNGNDPLYIVDGVPYTSTTLSFPETAGSILGGSADAYGSSPLNSINPSDIESIEILKDADATSIYGSRGANGVILITTKKGLPGKTNIDVNLYTGVANVARKMNVLHTAPYLEMRTEAFENDGYPPSAYDAPDLIVWDQARDTDWQDELIGGAAAIHDARVSIAGGDAVTQFMVGGGFHRESTVFPGSNHDQRLSLLASMNNHSRNEKLTTSFALNISRTSTDIISRDLTSTALSLAPNAPPLYDQNGELNWDGWSADMENPLAYLQRTYEANTSNLITNATVAYKIIRQLEAKVNVGFTTISTEAVTLYPISSYHPDQDGIVNQSVFGENHFDNWIAEPQLNWNSPLAKGTINILTGATFLDQNTNGIAQFAEGFSSEALMKNLAAAPSIFASTNFYADYRYQAFFGRLNYVLNEKYVLNLTARRDGSSRFGPGKQFAVFGATGAAWIFSNEAFISKALPLLSFGKLKASYGTTGNDQIGDYQYLNSYATSGTYQNGMGLTPSRLYNPDFAWEINRKLELGLELGIFDDRIMLITNIYRNRSSSQLVGAPLAPTTGFPTIQSNFPATVQNSGIEIELTSTNIKSPEGWEWTTSLNFTAPKNKLIEFPDIESSPAYDERYQVGQPLEIVKLYQYRGVDPATGEYVFRDVNEDGQYDIHDRKSVRFVGRKFYGGLMSKLNYAGFQLDFLFQFVKQDGYNQTHVFNRAPGTLANQPEDVMDRWTPADPANKNIQRFTAGGTSASEAYENYLYNSTGAISDASFMRLKSLYLAYTLNKNWMQKAHLQDLTWFVQGQNLITITEYKGLDPENPGSASLPPLRTWTAGIKLKI